MGETTGIAWCDHTFNPWIGCTKVSAGCAHCYAETLATNRMGLKWGDRGDRRVTSPAYWRQPLKWDREAKAAGVRRRVFCGSMCDVFEDRRDVELWRGELFRVIARTPNLDWLLLTKRPENVVRMGHEESLWSGRMPPNLWLGTSCEDQATADLRIHLLLAAPAAVRFLSCEPLLGQIKLRGPWEGCGDCDPCIHGQARQCGQGCWLNPLHTDGILWVIVGGESGPGHRRMDPAWARAIRDQCRAAGVAFFFKQSSGPRPGTNAELDGEVIQEFPQIAGHGAQGDPATAGLCS